MTHIATPGPLDRGLLKTYLDDHLTGATGVVARLRWMTSRCEDASTTDTLAALEHELTRERSTLLGLARHLGLRTSPWKPVAALAAERLGRLKPNGRATSRSPLSMHLELEALRSGISGKQSLWWTLETWAPALGVDPERFASLGADAQSQLRRVDALAEDVRRVALAPGTLGERAPAR